MLVFVPPDAMLSAPVPVMAVPDTLRLLTAVADSVPPVIVPPDKLPPDSVAPFIVEVQANAPELLVTVQPVLPEPPPKRMSPVETPPIWTWPVVPAFMVKFVAAVVAAIAGVAPDKLIFPVTPRSPVTLVAFWSSTVPTGLRMMLPLVVVWSVRLPEVVLSAALRLVLAMLLRLVFAPAAPGVAEIVHAAPPQTNVAVVVGAMVWPSTMKLFVALMFVM